jgi:outer membrane protein OmpA-like peptidoglycan-associated protein
MAKRVADNDRPWLTGHFRGEYIGYSKSGSMRKQNIYELRIVRGTITELERHKEQPQTSTKTSQHLKETEQTLNLENISRVYTHVQPMTFGDSPNITESIDNTTESWELYEKLHQVSIHNYTVTPTHYSNEDNTVHGLVTGTIVANLHPSIDPVVKNNPTPISSQNSMQHQSGCFDFPISARRLVLVSLLTLNNFNLDVLSIFNLHFFTVSITDLPSSEVEFADSDGDGIIDVKDDCIFRAEDKDGFEDNDGCPESDNDNDGVADDYDNCPNIKGLQKDGCPSEDQYTETNNIDNDNDGIPNSLDKCPEESETFNNYNDYDGCPDTIPKELQELIGVQTAIQFETNTDHLKPEATPELSKITELLQQHPSTQIIIEGHTDGKGTAQYNQLLSEKRADTIRNWIIGQGVGKNRVLTKGYGFRQPLANNDTEQGRAQNRRVEINCYHCELPNPEPPSANGGDNDSPSTHPSPLPSPSP